MNTHVRAFGRTVAVAALFTLIWSGGSGISSRVTAAQNVPPLPAPAGYVVHVSSEAELQAAVAALTSDTTIVISPGTYRLTSTLYVNGPLTNVTIRGATDSAADVVLVGRGMANVDYEAVPHGIATGGFVQNLTIANLTIGEVFQHSLMFDAGAQAPRVYNVRLFNAGRQFIRAFMDREGRGVDGGTVEYSTIEYTAASRDADTGGVDVAGGSGWTVRRNLFRNLEAPRGQLAGPAVLMWHGSRDSVVEGNLFLNCQREISFGLEDRPRQDHTGGVVRNNFIYRDAMVRGAAAIHLADAPQAQVLHNTILVHGASSALIEYRFSDTTGVVIRNNLLNGAIAAREGASGMVADNYTRAAAGMFVNPSAGDLHLKASATAVIDKAAPLPDAGPDFDGQARPHGSGADYGADEFRGALGSRTPPEPAPVEPAPAPTPKAAPKAPAPLVPMPETVSTASENLEPEASAASGALPTPWESLDIGNPAKPGSATWSSGTFHVTGGGADIGGNSDQFRFVYQTLEGDGELIARVTALERTQPWAKAGVMIRDELTGGAKYAGVFVTADRGVFFQRRIAAGATTTQTSGGSGKAPQWVKIIRSGDVFTAFRSDDGANWTAAGSEVVYLGRRAYVGLAVTSRSGRALTTATYTDVSVDANASTGNEPPTVAITTPSTGMRYARSSRIEISAAASDPDGTVSQVEFYTGSSLIGSSSRSPFAMTWANAPPGKHMLKAVARDDKGASTSSPLVEVQVAGTENQPPTVQITVPVNNATYTAPASMVVTAVASDPDGTISRVEFYEGQTLLRSDATSPYSVAWNGVPVGTYTLTAVARDNAGASTTSAPVTITVSTAPVNQPPTVSLTAPANGAAFSAPASIAMSATAADADGSIAKVEFYAGSTLVGTDATSPYSVTWNSVPAGTYTLSAKAFDNSGASTISSGVNVAVGAAPALPAPWTSADIGSPAVAGSASHSSGTFTVKGAGTDIGSTTDQFRYVYQPFQGDGEISACVASLDFVDAWSKAGVMFRETLTGESRNAMALVSAGFGVAFQHRASSGGTTSMAGTAPAVAPHCVRLVRQGSQFTAYQSVNGSSWTELGSQTIEMNAAAFVGLAVTSHKADTAAQAIFNSVTVTAASSNEPPVVFLKAPSDGATFDAPVNITLTADASDPDGTVAKVEFYAGSTLVGSDLISPFSRVWSGAPAGTHTLTAVAYDNEGASTTSAPITITVRGNQAPVVSLTAPASGASFTAPATIAVSATASDTDGTVARVDFFAGATLIGSDTTSPYSVSWSNVAAGSYSLTARAFANSGASTTSSPVSITVTPANQAPTVSLSAPANNASFQAPASITVSATAADGDGTVAKVDFFAGATLIGSDTTSPYSVSWNNVAAGTYSLTAKAFDNSGASTTSSPVSITVTPANQAPSVSLTAPASNASFQAPATITVSATAADSDGTVAKVDFFAGATLIGSDATSPYSVSWSNVAAGTYSLTARAFDNSGASTTSAPVSITVTPANQAPTVSLTGPANNASFQAPATVTVSATAADSDGTVAKVDFFAGATLIGSDTTSPYSVSWSNVAAGTYSLTAKAFDNSGASTTSAPVSITVTPANQAPSVSLTAPANNASFQAPATITVSATAADSDGTVAKVDFFAGATLIGSDTTSPYSVGWSNVAAGTYSLTARAFDNSGASTTSSPVSITVTPANQAPTVSLTAPANSASFQAPATITVSATAADSDGTVAKVDFFAGATLIGSDTTSPYSVSWSNVAAGTYSLTARAFDNSGASTTSAPVSITVANNTPPVVSLTAPSNGATFTAPVSVIVSANASDSDGTIARVDFFAGSTLIGSDTTNPYSIGWSNAPVGTHTLTAVARDNSGATTTSAPVSITIALTPPKAVVFTASVDHGTLVTSYTVEVFTAGSNPSTTAPFRTQNAGKPTPVNGDITVDVSAMITGLPAGSYFITVSATGSGGTSRSAPSETFVR